MPRRKPSVEVDTTSSPRRSKPRASIQAAPPTASAGKAQRRSAGATTPRQRATTVPAVTAATCSERQPLCLCHVVVPTSLAPAINSNNTSNVAAGLRMDVEVVPNPAIDSTIQAAVQNHTDSEGDDDDDNSPSVEELERQIRRYFQLQRTLAMEPPACPPAMALEGACEVALRQPLAQAAVLAKLSHAAGMPPGALVARIPRRDLVRWQQNWRASVGSTPRAKMLAQLRDCMLTTPPAAAMVPIAPAAAAPTPVATAAAATTQAPTATAAATTATTSQPAAEAVTVDPTAPLPPTAAGSTTPTATAVVSTAATTTTTTTTS